MHAYLFIGLIVQGVKYLFFLALSPVALLANSDINNHTNIQYSAGVYS